MRAFEYDEVDPRHAVGPTVRREVLSDDLLESRVVLCLSGGGQRAAAYHLGALRRLWELELLDELDEVRAVSGGSYVAAWTASVLSGRDGDWRSINWDADISEPFRCFLESDLRSRPVMLTLPVNWFWKAPRMRLLERRLRGVLPMCEAEALVLKPNIRLLATDLVGPQLVELPDPNMDGSWSLARAVVASSAFPPFIGPGHVSRSGRPMRLSDGGLWGNLGMAGETILTASVLFMSDASYPSGISGSIRLPRPWALRALRVAARRADAVVRYQAWMSDASRRRLQVWAIDKTTHRVEDDHPALEYPAPLVGRIAAIRTDLDGLSGGERRILENHGYLRAASCISWLAHRARRDDGHGVEGSPDETGVMRKLVHGGPRPIVRPPFPEYMDEAKCWAALGRA